MSRETAVLQAYAVAICHSIEGGGAPCQLERLPLLLCPPPIVANAKYAKYMQVDAAIMTIWF